MDRSRCGRGAILRLALRSKAAAHPRRSRRHPAIFLPRDTGLTRHAAPPVRASVGATTRAGAESLGVRLGQTITMPKQYVRLAGTRATGGRSTIAWGAPRSCLH